MSDSDVPAAPDYSPIINAQTNLANSAIKNGTDMMKWAKEQFANNRNLADMVTQGLIRTRDTAMDASDDARSSSDDLLGIGEERLKDNLDKYTDPTRRAANMGAAQAQVAQNFDAARDNATRELEGFGINPASTRFAALDLGARTQQAAAMASAGNVASRTDDALADQAADKLITQGNTRDAAANTAAGIANQAGMGASGVDLATTASGANTMGTNLAWTGAAGNALQGAAGTTNQQYTNQADQFKNEKSNSSGIGSLIGGIAGLGKDTLGGSMLSSIGGSLMMALEEGGAIPAVGPGGVPEGGAIPVGASPSRGAVTDDIPAKVNAGEFIVPKDVAAWKGEEFFQKLIMQSRKMKEEAPAKPAIGPARGGPDPAEPAFRPRPASGGALPLR